MNTLVRNTRPFGFNHLPQDWFSGSPLYCAPSEMKSHFASSPAVNIIENEESFEIQLVAPGFSKENFNLKVSGNTLDVTGTIEKTEDQKETKFTRKEFKTASFSRQFTLPIEKVDTEAISAKYQDGILYVVVPKKAEAKPAERTISIEG